MFSLAPEREPDGAAVFVLDAQPSECGQFATQIRIYPWHELLTHPFEVGLMKEL
jgi:starch phosphorylase